MRQCRIGGLQSDVGAAAHRDANRRRFHCRRIVDPVADHGQRRLGVERHHRLHFIRRQQPGAERQPQFAGDSRRRARIVAGQYDSLNA